MRQSKPLKGQQKKIPTFTGEEIVNALDNKYPTVETVLAHSDVFQLLIATILSAQSTDAEVNRVTPKLFAHFPDPASLSKGRIKEIESLIRSTGFYHVKAKRIKDVSLKLISEFGGKVPSTMEELLTLPGIGRKTANIVLSAGYGLIQGIAVDRHVFRVSRRIGLTDSNTPEKIELDLMKITSDRTFWPRLSMLLIFHGRGTCVARKPKCDACPLANRCLYFQELKVSGRAPVL